MQDCVILEKRIRGKCSSTVTRNRRTTSKHRPKVVGERIHPSAGAPSGDQRSISLSDARRSARQKPLPLIFARCSRQAGCEILEAKSDRGSVTDCPSPPGFFSLYSHCRTRYYYRLHPSDAFTCASQRSTMTIRRSCV